MLKRLKVKNYQSIADADIELEPFTLFVGHNRAGKSATLRALRGLIKNQTGNGFIRQGQNTCVVSVDTEEGDTITWTKTKTTAEYEVNGDTYTKLAGDVPSVVKNVLGIKEIEVDSTLTLWPQLHMQLQDAFLVDRSAGQAARALAKMTRLDVVVKAQIACKSVIRKIKERQKSAQERLEIAQEELKEFEFLDEQIEYNTDLASAAGQTNKLLNRVTDIAKAVHLWDMYEEDASLVIPDAEILQTTWVMLDEYEIALNAAAQLDIELPEVPEIDHDMLLIYGEVEATAAEYREAAWRVVDAEENLRENELEKRAILKELEKYAGKECPVCGGVL